VADISVACGMQHRRCAKGMRRLGPEGTPWAGSGVDLDLVADCTYNTQDCLWRCAVLCISALTRPPSHQTTASVFLFAVCGLCLSFAAFVFVFFYMLYAIFGYMHSYAAHGLLPSC
jgi:hypothetical protein